MRDLINEVYQREPDYDYKVWDWFKEMGWKIEDGLDTEEKEMLFKLKFL